MIRYAYWNWGDFKRDQLLRECLDDVYWDGFSDGGKPFTSRPIRGFNKKDELQ